MSVDFLREQRNFVDWEKFQNCISAKDRYEKLDHRDLGEIIMIIRDGLLKRYNYLFKLIYEEGLDFSEIAEIMGLKLNAVQKLKFGMIKNVIKKAKLKDLYHEPEIFMISPYF